MTSEERREKAESLREAAKDYRTLSARFLNETADMIEVLSLSEDEKKELLEIAGVLDGPYEMSNSQRKSASIFLCSLAHG